MIAEFEAGLARARTGEGLAVAKAKGRLRGKPPKLKPTQEAHLVKLWQGGEHSTLELAELFSVSRATVYRAIQRAGAGTPGKASCDRAHRNSTCIGCSGDAGRVGCP